jgi:hypothetical protein
VQKAEISILHGERTEIELRFEYEESMANFTTQCQLLFRSLRLVGRNFVSADLNECMDPHSSSLKHALIFELKIYR